MREGDYQWGCDALSEMEYDSDPIDDEIRFRERTRDGTGEVHEQSRRAVLSGLGGSAVLGALGAFGGTGIGARGEPTMNTSVPLEGQHVNGEYVTAVDSAFDPSVLDEGEAFWVTDSGEIGVWDGDSPVHPGLGSDSNPVGPSNFESINSVLYARTPDEITDKLRELPPSGGTVKLVPGEYDDDDWSEPIEIPADGDPVSAWRIDMQGSRIDLSGFQGPYIYKGQTATRSAPVHIHGPDRFWVNDVDEPGVVMKLWDTRANRIYWPNCFGPVEAIYEDRSANGSGHWSQVYVRGVAIRKGIVIGHEDDTQTADRSIFYGQLNNIREVGVEVNKGQSNHFFVQPENGYDDDTEAIGYKIRYGGNTIYDWHEGRNIQTLDIEAPYTIIRPTGRLALSSYGRVRKFSVSVPPRQIHGSYAFKHVEQFQTDTLDEYAIESEGDSSVSLDSNYSRLVLQSGENDGDVAAWQYPTGIGRSRRGGIMSATIHPRTVRDQVIRIGVTNADEGDFESGVSFYVEWESDTGDSWEFVVVNESGQELDRVSTGIPLSDSYGQEIIFNWSRDHQTCFINYERAAETSSDVGNYPTWLTCPRIEIETKGNGTNARRFDVIAVESMNWPMEFFHMEGGYDES